jgi:glycosyltransferase involved in cell wall biosynthesis
MPSRLGTALQTASLIQKNRQEVMRWLRSAERVVVVAGWLKEVLVRNGVKPEQIAISHHGLSESLYTVHREAASLRSSHRNEQRLRVGFVGRFTEVKGAHVLINAVRSLPADVGVELHLYGIAKDDRDRAYLERIKQSARGSLRVQFCGKMTAENRLRVFASFDMLAVPSIWFETGPFTVLEAFAAGIPVLGSNHGGIAERVDDGVSGILVSPGDVGAWREALMLAWKKYIAGIWDWTLPRVRASQEIANEMTTHYNK